MTSDTSHHISALVEKIRMGPRRELLTQPDALFELGEAPDGLPLVLHVRRKVDVRAAVLAAIHHPKQMPEAIEASLRGLERAIEQHVLARGVVARQGVSYYETWCTAEATLGATLLDKALGTLSPMVLPEELPYPGAPARAEARAENSALFSLADLSAVATAAGGAPAVSARTSPAPTFGRDARLRISLAERAHEVFAGPVSESGEREDDVPPGRAVVWESLGALRSARFVVRDAYNHATEGRLADGARYRDALRPGRALGWSVSRADVGTLLVELARSVDATWHARERVHGDIKPANVLLRRDGIDAFDALDVAAGELSAGLTASWAAPEQLLARAVTPATDVFALGLMTVSLLGAALYGEECALIIPARGAGRKRIKRIADPEVWIDPTVLDWPAKARVAWREFLMRCLASAPARRPQRGRDFAAELAGLLTQWEPPGRLKIACGPGQLEFLGDTDAPAWVLCDAR